MTPLASLLAAVEAGDDLAVDETNRQMARDAHDKGATHYAHEIGRAYYRKSTDAAIALCEAMLPGWKWGLRSHDEIEGDDFFVWLNSPDYRVHCWTAGDKDSCDVVAGLRTSADADDPARALLIAMLRALVAEEGE